jgi:hypothetical protein
MMFLLVMEVLRALIHKVDSWSLWQSLGVRAIPLRDSLYTDNLILFISPSARDLQRTRSILSMFEDASGLACNLDKCQMAPIGCEEEHLVVAADEFPCQIAFPMKYLGIPLSATKLPRSAL